MQLTLIEQHEGHATVVNTEQITYLRQDVYGTAIHFSSGEHVICPMDIDALVLKLHHGTAESLLIKTKG